jgi:hypothetical protein
MSRLKVLAEDKKTKTGGVQPPVSLLFLLFILFLAPSEVFYPLHKPVKRWPQQKCDQHEQD